MILVTGGTGLVGTHLLMELVNGDLPVRVLYRDLKSIEKVKSTFSLYNLPIDPEKSFEWVKCDLLNPEELFDAFEGVTQVYHCAAMVSFNKRDKEKMFKVNIEGTENVVNASIEAGVSKLCHVSSTAAIGKAPKGGVRDESHQWQDDGTVSNYSVSKYLAEMEVWRGVEEGLNAVIVNPSVIIGPGDWTATSSNLFLKVWKGLKFYTHGVTAFVDVRDVVKAMITLMASDISAERFLVVGENWSYKDLFDHIARGLGKKLPHIEVKKWMTNIIWRLEAVKSFLFGSDPLVTKESATTAMSVNKYSNEKIKTTIGFEFTPIEEAIAHTSKLFKKDQS